MDLDWVDATDIGADHSAADRPDGDDRRLEEADGSVPDDVLERAHDDVVGFAEGLTKINGDPVDYSDRYQFWRKPLRAAVDPDTARIHIWKMARGIGKTEQSKYPELWLPVTNAMLDVMHAVPRSDQLNSYMKRTVARGIETSRGDPPILEAALESPDVAVKRNKFTTGSFLEARSAWADGRALQGFHGSFGTADECQNWTPAALQNLKEAVDSPLPGGADEGGGRILLTGTPDTEGTIYHEHWTESTQHRWHVDCPECGQPQTITLDNVHVVATSPKRWGLVCRGCDGDLEKDWILRNGYWEATNETGVHRGYTFTQLLSPRHPLDEVMRARDLASTSTADFHRFKLARFYSGGARPIPEAAIYACCDPDLSLHTRKTVDRPHFAGVDWGGGDQADTIVVVLTCESRDRDSWPDQLTVRDVERIDYEHRPEELRKVAAVLDRFDVGYSGRAVCDLGHGEAHVDALQGGDRRENAIPETGWGSNVFGHRFVNMTSDQGEQWPYLQREGRTVQAARTPWANRVFDLFPEVQGYDDPPDPADVDYQVERTPDKRIRIPYADATSTRDTMQYWFDHLSAVKREFDETKTGQRRERITTFQSNQKDDGFFALLYAYTAALLRASSSRSGTMSVGGMTA